MGAAAKALGFPGLQTLWGNPTTAEVGLQALELRAALQSLENKAEAEGGPSGPAPTTEDTSTQSPQCWQGLKFQLSTSHSQTCTNIGEEILVPSGCTPGAMLDLVDFFFFFLDLSLFTSP